MLSEQWLNRQGFPSGSETRRRGGARRQGGSLAVIASHRQSSAVAESNTFSLTRGQVFGRIIPPRIDLSRLRPDVRPAPQAGCFVSSAASAETVCVEAMWHPLRDEAPLCS